MNDPDAGRYQRLFQTEYRIAELVLLPFGGQLAWSTSDYIAFTYRDKDVSLVFYPHKTRSTGNRAIRVRDDNSANKRRARELELRLRIGSGYFTTFHSRNDWSWGEELKLAKRDGLTMGWARERLAA